jgi:energy-coupling factor transporter ATP-binding protein EcfA2
MEDMAAYCDNVVVMNRSKVFLTGSCRDVFSRSPELTKIGLDSPMVSRISDILLGKGIALEGELYSLEGLKNAITEYLRRKRNDI